MVEAWYFYLCGIVVGWTVAVFREKWRRRRMDFDEMRNAYLRATTTSNPGASAVTITNVIPPQTATVSREAFLTVSRVTFSNMLRANRTYEREYLAVLKVADDLAAALLDRGYTPAQIDALAAWEAHKSEDQ